MISSKPIPVSGNSLTLPDAKREAPSTAQTQVHSVNPSQSAQKFSRFRSAEARVRAAGNVEESTLAAAVLIATHPKYGDLTITRQAKEKNDKELMFNFELIEKNGNVVRDISHSMFVTKSARNYSGRSAVGYNYIDLDELQGKGIGYLYHAVAAAATELAVELFVVDDVAEDAMRALCVGVKMEESFNSYSLSPDLMEQRCREKAVDVKGWVIQK